MEKEKKDFGQVLEPFVHGTKSVFAQQCLGTYVNQFTHEANKKTYA